MIGTTEFIVLLLIASMLFGYTRVLRAVRGFNKAKDEVTKPIKEVTDELKVINKELKKSSKL